MRSIVALLAIASTALAMSGKSQVFINAMEACPLFGLVRLLFNSGAYWVLLLIIKLSDGTVVY